MPVLKLQKQIGNYRIKQFQLGYFSIDMQAYYSDESLENQRTLLASNVYSIENENEVWILDSGYSKTLSMPFLKERLRYSFLDVLNYYQQSKNIYILLSHCHPDHIGGLMEHFSQIKKEQIRIFFNIQDFNPDFYSEYRAISSFIDEELFLYDQLFDIRRCSFFNAVFIGGHSPEHTLLKLKDEALYYTADLIPTAFHISHHSSSERNYSQEKFDELHKSSVELFRKEKATLLLAHAPNDGIFSL